MHKFLYLENHKIIYISFYIMKIKNNIYGAHTSVDPGMSNMGDASC